MLWDRDRRLQSMENAGLVEEEARIKRVVGDKVRKAEGHVG